MGLRAMARPGRCIGWLLAAFWLLAVPAEAQLDRSRLTGTIKDESGAIVPGATVTATNLQTKTPAVVVTDASGYYNFPNLTPGQYSITAELSGFRKVVRENVQLDAAGAITMDFTLQAGALTETVTVSAETPLQTDVAVRKTVEAKDIELLSFSGRNPIGVVGLKAGVNGGNFNSRGFGDLGNGGFNINGSRADENNITIDGATAIRTRSSGAIIGIQNVDAVQEVQVLTANYMPEYGRASGGQIRFITKSGSNRFTGAAGYYLRDESLQANSWARNRSTNPLDNQGPAAFDYKQYGYSFGGPIAVGQLRNKLFFFGAQEWVDFNQISTNTATVPTARMRVGDFSELLDPNNGFFTGARIIRDPQTGQPFPGNIIPTGRLSPTGMAMLRAFPDPTPGFRQGTANLSQSSDVPTEQRKDNLRFDYRLNDKNTFVGRYSGYAFTELAAFQGTFPFARRIFDRPNFTFTSSWTGTITNNLIAEAGYTRSRDDVFIDVYTGTDLYKRSRTGINYPYIFPDNKEIPDKIPTINIAGFSSIDGGPYPGSSRGPIHTFSGSTTYVRGRHTFKAGIAVEYSGEDDFDQINVNSIPGGTNNQNGQFAFNDLSGAANSTNLGIANAAIGLFDTYAEIGQRAFTKWRSLATDLYIQDSWRPTSQLTIEGGLRYVIWPPWYSTTNNIANFDVRFFDQAQKAIINPTTGRLVGGSRYNGIVLPGDGFEGEGNDLVVASNPAVLALFRGEPRGFSETHYNVFEPRLGVSYSINPKTIVRASAGVFHNRTTLNDSTLLGGQPPFQPMVTVASGSADNPGGGSGGGSDLPFGSTAQDPVFKHPTSYMVSAGVQREVPWGFVVDATYVGRKGLYLQRERNINQPEAGTIQRNPGVNIAALRPYTGYGALRLSENAGSSKTHSLQLTADRRYMNSLKVGVAYTLSKTEDNGSDKRNVVWNTYDDTLFWGPANFDRRHNFNVYYIYDVPFWREQNTLIKNLLGGWQISGATFMRSGRPVSVVRTNLDTAGVGDPAFGQPVNLVGDINAGANREFSNGSDQNFWFNPAAFALPAAGTFGNAPRNLIYNPGEQQWDLALFKNFELGGTKKAQFRAEFFNFPNHPNWSSVQTGTLNGDILIADPSNASFGRVTSKTGQRDIQLSIRFIF